MRSDVFPQKESAAHLTVAASLWMRSICVRGSVVVAMAVVLGDAALDTVQEDDDDDHDPLKKYQSQ
ncbi:hypothetical protein BDW_06860 [Bdellovibrio bacteriovorus W]|nr:hypothetical protein BDW_06860 [Bdellovibrio bacteriovorus W]